ncbi:helix-turn-helix transcriptional regulator [Ramlibacter sp. XY19]|uniref:helix-turn-helix transcriptional regulator n=1 Tax=Ramlibacter paludis TaxID=2908000 RepID=UPI0023DC147D|nr:helix-turn-helix transcriptional regulator [Ramlibacter paludis]MCG2591758.1 helix-turn-helix transcriptional regulator [Ramlibacter paludis]
METPFLLDLYRLARECTSERFPSEALALLRRQLPFDSGRWLRSTYIAPRSIQVNEAVLFNDSPEMLAAHELVIEQNAPNWRAVCSPALGPFAYAYNSAAMFNTPATGEIREYQRRYAHENTLNAIVKRRLPDCTRYRMIALHRARTDDRFTAREVSRMSLLLPHFVEALAVNTIISNAACASNHPFSVGVADQDRSVLFAEDRLREMLRMEWPEADMAKVPLPLWEAVARTSVYAGRTLVAQSGVAHGMVFLRVRRRCGADGLSPRELEAARLDGAGFTYKEIARRMGIAPVTARNVLQRVHEKLAARNRGEVNQALSLLGRVF